MSNTDLAIISSLQRVDMERREAVRAAADTLFRRDLGLPRETVRAHVAEVLLASVIKQERWSRGQA